MKREKKIIKVIIFFLLFGVIFMLVQKVLTPKWIYGSGDSSQGETNRYQTFYQLKKDSLDYLTIGDSKSYYSTNPALIYAETGYIGYSLGCTGEGIGVVYYWLEEALKYQSPKYIFWDACALLSDSTISISNKYETTASTKALTYMRFGTTKIKACIDNQTEEKNWMQLLVPMLSFHTRWDELKKEDFSYSNADYALMGAYIRFNKENFSERLNRNKRNYVICDLSGEISQDNREISENNKKYFEKIYELCNKNQVRLVPFLGQTQFLTDNDRDTINQFLKNYDLNWLTFTDDELGIDWNKDTPDTGNHLNYWGNCKYSENLAKWMQEQSELSEYRNVNTKNYWDIKLKQYEEFETNTLINSKEKVLSYFQTLETNKEKCCIIITVKDEACASFYDHLGGCVERLGLQDEFNEKHLQNSYIAVVDAGNVLFQRWEAAPLRLESVYKSSNGDEISMQVESGGYVYNNVSIIQIGDTDYSVNRRGLNIVVLDNESGKVISSVSIDTHDSSLSFFQKELDRDAANIWSEYIERSQVLQDGVYMIHPYGNPEYSLDIADGSWEDNGNLQLWDSTGEKPQQFELHHVGNGLYTIKALNSGKYLTAYQYGNTNGTNVVQDSYTGLANQKWYIYRDRSGAYCIMSHYNKLVMDVAGTRSYSGANIFLYEVVFKDWQAFEFVRMDN